MLEGPDSSPDLINSIIYSLIDVKSEAALKYVEELYKDILIGYKNAQKLFDSEISFDFFSSIIASKGGRSVVKLPHYYDSDEVLRTEEEQENSIPQRIKDKWINGINLEKTMFCIYGEFKDIGSVKKALKNGFEVQVVCGNKFLNDETKNQILELLKYYPKKLKIYILDFRPRHHSVFIGNSNLIIESEHSAGESYAHAYQIEQISEDGKLIFINEFNKLIRRGKEGTCDYIANLPIYEEIKWNAEGKILIKNGRFLNAVDAYDTSIKLNKNMVSSWHNKGVALHYLGQYLEAIECFNQAIIVNQNNVDAFHKKDSEDDEFEPGSAKSNGDVLGYPGIAQIFNSKGASYHSLSKFGKALKCYREAIINNNKYASSWRYGAVVYSAIGRFNDALAGFKKARELEDKSGYIKDTDEIDLFEATPVISASDYEKAFNCYYSAAIELMGDYIVLNDKLEKEIKLRPLRNFMKQPWALDIFRFNLKFFIIKILPSILRNGKIDELEDIGISVIISVLDRSDLNIDDFFIEISFKNLEKFSYNELNIYLDNRSKKLLASSYEEGQMNASIFNEIDQFNKTQWSRLN